MTPASRATCILRTSRLWDADLACNRLDEFDVPHYRRQETSAGLELAMPAAPAPAPAVWFTVWVPDDAVDAAHDALRDVPIDLDREPEVVDRATTPGNRRVILLGAALMLAFVTFGLLQQCAGLIREVAGR